MGFPGGSDGKESAYNVGALGSIPGLGRYPGGGHGNPLQYSCLGNLHVDWQAIVHGVSRGLTQLSDLAQHSIEYIEYIKLIYLSVKMQRYERSII